MKAILFGASGMVGQSVLRECLLDPGVSEILSVGRSTTGKQDSKLRELVHQNFLDFSAVQDQLAGYEACFYCLGVASAGMKEEDYSRITYEFTLAAAWTLAPLNPGMTFIFVSGQGTDSTEQGSSMWARVKGRTENALLKLPFKAVYVFRPGYIQPLYGVTSRTKLYQTLYVLTNPVFPLLKFLFPKSVTTSEQLGRAMVKAAKYGAPKKILETADINQL